MSKTTQPQRGAWPLPTRKGTIAEVKRIPFKDIPTDLIDLSVLMESGDPNKADTVRYVYPLLRWARDKAMLFDDDTVIFLTIKQLSTAWNKGNYVVFDETEYVIENKEGTRLDKAKKGAQIVMEQHKNWGWRPQRKVKPQSIQSGEF